MIPKKILKKIPIIRRVYPSLVKKLFKLISKSEIKFNFFGINLIGDINEPMDKEIYLFNQYENKQIIFLIENIKKSNFEYFIDVGANSGVYSLIVNKEFKYIKIKSYEPIKKSIEKFIINKKMNQKLKNIRIYKYGLSDRNMHLLMKSQIRDKYVQTGGFGVVTKKDRINDFHTEKAVFKKGADILFYPTAIGDEPRSSIDSSGAWQRVMQGHAAANIVPVVASNRIGFEKVQGQTNGFYGKSFICDHTGLILKEASRDKEEILIAEIDTEENHNFRRNWGLFRDRRTDLYSELLTLDGNN